MVDTRPNNRETNKLVLALDTSSDALALGVGRVSKCEEGWRIEPVASNDQMARRQANVRLVPAIDKLFDEHNLCKEDLVCVVCGLGPGSFTGVRIAVATAKGLAAGLGVPLFGVVTPDASAWQAWQGGVRGSLAVLCDAMRGEVYPARYTLNEQGVQREDPPSVIKAAALREKWQHYESDLMLTGDALQKYGELFSGFAWLDKQYWHPEGRGLLASFEAQLQAGGATPELLGALLKGAPDIAPQPSESFFSAKERLQQAIQKTIASLLPLYTRLSDAEENERKRLVSGGAIAQGALTELPPSGVAWPLQEGQNTFRPAASIDVMSMASLEQRAFATQDANNNAVSCDNRNDDSTGIEAPKSSSWNEAQFKADLGLSDRSWWVCYRGNELAGFIGGQLLDGQMHVLDVVVDGPYQRQGIAGQLMTYLARDARDLGATTLTLEVRAGNEAALSLYRKLGFEELGKRKEYYPPLAAGKTREDALIMSINTEVLLQNAQDTYNSRSKTSAGSTGEEGSMQDASPYMLYQDEGYCQSHLFQHPLILALETSCDETAVALIDGEGSLLSNVIASQTSFHARFGGVVPEIASRKHTEVIYPAVLEAMENRSWKDLDAIAVTYAPGLIGALVVGLAFAKGLCWATELPLILVNHLEGHIYANRFVQTRQTQSSLDDVGKTFYQVDATSLQPPFIIALLSGGNTMLVHVKQWGSYQVLGETLDDAVGEAYDKVAKALGLGYPGGPVIARLATEGNPKAIEFPRAMLHSHDFQFSLSGLKTAVLTAIRQQEAAGSLNLADIAASFEQAVIEVQVAKALQACESLGVSTFCIGGGVAANLALRKAYETAMKPKGISVVYPPQLACTDNAAMIAAVALDRFKAGRFASLASDAAAQANIEKDY